MHWVICGVIVHSVMENPRAYRALTGMRSMKPNQYLHYLVGTVLLFMGICSAQASTVVLEDYQSISGYTVSNTPFVVEQAGIYEAFIVDLKYPAAIDNLFLGILDNVSFTPLGFRYGEGSFTFNVSTPGQLVAQFAGLPGTGGVGTYALQIKAIPIPPAAILFFSGLMGLVLVARRGSIV